MTIVALASRCNLELIAQSGKLFGLTMKYLTCEAILGGVNFDELPLRLLVLQDIVLGFEMTIAVEVAGGLSCSSPRILLNSGMLYRAPGSEI